VLDTHIIPAIVKLRKEDLRFEACLGYTVRPCKNKKQTNNKNNKKRR
jgi:hypothetical protein